MATMSNPLETDLQTLQQEAEKEITAVDSLEALEQLRINYLGKKGKLSQILRGMGKLSAEERPRVGSLANEVKEALQSNLETQRNTLETAKLKAQLAAETLDVTMPGVARSLGRLDPLNSTIDRVLDIFVGLGYQVSTGPHVRTHTSPVQIRYMETHEPPIRIVAPGRVYRRDTVDATHSAVFHQVEILAVDKGLTFADLKGTIKEFLTQMFGEELPVKFRASYFPFTEPSAEVDVQWKGKWLEVMGCGMVDPNVLKAVGYDPEVYTGFAAGLGIERFAMVLHQIDDIRRLYNSDMRFLSQF